MKKVWLAWVLCQLLVLGACQQLDVGALRQQSSPGPQGAEEGPSHRQRWLIPISEQLPLMGATLWRPPGRGPYPLAVISHASAEDPDQRIEDPTPKYESLALWLTQHGFAVLLPVRPGHAGTGGPYLEEQGGCDDADYVTSGLATAASIEAALAYMAAQPFVKKDRAVVIGVSAGGWGAIALAGRKPPAVKAVINFAGGRGGHSSGEANSNCASDRLVAAAVEFGKTARIPNLWLYAENDSFFGPRLSKQLADGFRSTGGQVEYHLLPPVGDEGHYLAQSADAVRLWGPIVERFLARIH
jgi:dienelactone hydrolase